MMGQDPMVLTSDKKEISKKLSIPYKFLTT
jgi:hypothetical protein